MALSFGYALGTSIGRRNETNITKVKELCKDELGKFEEELKGKILRVYKRGKGTTIRIDFDSITEILYDKVSAHGLNRSHGITIDDCYHAIPLRCINDLNTPEYEICSTPYYTTIELDDKRNAYVVIDSV